MTTEPGEVNPSLSRMLPSNFCNCSLNTLKEKWRKTWKDRRKLVLLMTNYHSNASLTYQSHLQAGTLIAKNLGCSLTIENKKKPSKTTT